MNQVYDFKRIVLLARFKFSLHKKVLMLSVLGYFALLFIIGFLIAYGNRSSAEVYSFFIPFHYVGMYFMIGMGSILLAARSFQDMNNPEKAISQLLIPASTFEKFILPLLATTIGWIAFSLISYHLFSLLFNGIWVAAFGYQFEVFNGLDVFQFPLLFDIIMGYFVLHSAFFLGATAFKKYPIVKTILVQFVLNWSFSLLALILIIILFGSVENFGMAMDSLDDILNQKEWYLNMIKSGRFDPEVFAYKARYLWRFVMFLLTMALYVTAYFKLKEREV